MNIHGPNWPSTQALREALQDVEGEFVWGERQDKLEQLQALAVGGVNTPNYSLTPVTGWWGRKRRHTQGKDIVVNPYNYRWRSCDFWVEQIMDVKDEWRVHVFGGLMIASARKSEIAEENCRHGKFRLRCKVCSVIRSRRNGWRLVRDKKPSETVRNTAKAAVAALERKYGAVDLIERNDGSVVVLEVNFAPAMDGRTLRAYVKAIRREIN